MGESVVIDASFAEPRHRRMAEDLAGRVADLTAFHCLAPEQVVRRRLLARESRPDRWSDAGADIGSTLAEGIPALADGRSAGHERRSRLDTTVGNCHPCILFRESPSCPDAHATIGRAWHSETEGEIVINRPMDAPPLATDSSRHDPGHNAHVGGAVEDLGNPSRAATTAPGRRHMHNAVIRRAAPPGIAAAGTSAATRADNVVKLRCLRLDCERRPAGGDRWRPTRTLEQPWRTRRGRRAADLCAPVVVSGAACSGTGNLIAMVVRWTPDPVLRLQLIATAASQRRARSRPSIGKMPHRGIAGHAF